MSICPIDADDCLIKTVTRTSINANKVSLFQGNSKHKKCWQKDLCLSTELCGCMKKCFHGLDFKAIKNFFLCNMNIYIYILNVLLATAS